MLKCSAHSWTSLGSAAMIQQKKISSVLPFNVLPTMVAVTNFNLYFKKAYKIKILPLLLFTSCRPSQVWWVAKRGPQDWVPPCPCIPPSNSVGNFDHIQMFYLVAIGQWGLLHSAALSNFKRVCIAMESVVKNLVQVGSPKAHPVSIRKSTPLPWIIQILWWSSLPNWGAI